MTLACSTALATSWPATAAAQEPQEQAQEAPPSEQLGPRRPPPPAEGEAVDAEELAKTDPMRVLAFGAELLQRYRQTGDARALNAAEELFDLAEANGVPINTVRFQRAQLRELQGELQEAADLYRAILVDEPDTLRVRLELGRVYFLMEDDAKARLQFNYALAGNLPEPVADNVLRFLERIRARRNWSVGFEFAFAPDTNVNAATSQRTVDINGLPFVLSEDAREESGVGVDVRFFGVYDHVFNPFVALRQAASLRSVQYAGDEFDDTNLAVSAGPLVRVAPDQEMTFEGVFGRRWFGGEGYSTYTGVRSTWEGRLSERVELNTLVQGTYLEHDEAERLDGPRLVFSLSPLYALTPRSLLRARVTLDRSIAESDADSSVGLYTGVGLFTEIPLGFTVYGEPGIELRRYDEENAGFGDRRDSVTASFELNFRNRRLDFYGFTPLIGGVISKRWSRIDLYDYERARFTLGVTRAF